MLQRTEPQLLPLLGMEPAKTLDRVGEQSRLLASRVGVVLRGEPGGSGRGHGEALAIEHKTNKVKDAAPNLGVYKKDFMSPKLVLHVDQAALEHIDSGSRAIVPSSFIDKAVPSWIMRRPPDRVAG